jgi:aryl-alcohol dehydrogenase-like predicted oxidoreductase
MRYMQLGRTGVMVSQLCLGTMNFGSRTPENEAACMIDQAIDSGLNFIDTANIYGEAKEGAGRGEEIIGKALSRNNRRNRIILATKVGLSMDADDPNSTGLSRRHIIAECEASLTRLCTDYIDLYQLHRPSPGIPIDEILRVLDDLIHSGKVRYIGTSQFSAWQIMEALWSSDRLGLNRLVTEQPFYNMIDRSIENDLIPMAQNYGLAILPYSPLDGGILTGKYQRGIPYPEDSRFTFNKWTGVWDTDLTNHVFDLIDVLTEIARDKNCTISQLALAWTMSQPGITSVVIGPRTQIQLADNIGAINVIVTEMDRARINSITRPKGKLIEN